MVSEVGVDGFSVRDLAKSLGLVPGTIHARFGNKNELLAQLYIQRMRASCDLLDGMDRSSVRDVAAYLEAVSHHLPGLRREFVLYFERDRPAKPHLSSSTWDEIETVFRLLLGKVYERFREAAQAESVHVVDGSNAERLTWTIAAALDSSRAEVAFNHAEADYRRFAAHTLLASLAKPARRSGTAHRSKARGDSVDAVDQVQHGVDGRSHA